MRPALSTPRILGFKFDDDNEDKFADHGISSRQVAQILGNDYLVASNRRRRRGLYLVIGRDNGGACITVPVEPTRERGVWRPITAWPCKRVEQTRLERKGI